MLTKFDIDLDPNFGDDYTAYVYRITITFDDGTFKIYIGAHKGSILDSYDFSSEDEEFLEDLLNPDNKIYFEIVKKGTEYDMFDLENQMLEEVNAKNNNNYYNSTNGGSRYTSISARIESYATSIIEKFNNGEYDEYVEYISVDEIKEYKRAQVRIEEKVVSDKEYTDQIADQINYKHGKTDFLPPCLSFDGWSRSIARLWVDGSQREESVNKSKRGKKVKTIVLPKRIWKVFTKGLPEGEISSLIFDIACLLNPLTTGPLNMKPAEIANRIFQRSKAEDQINSKFNERFLAKQNRVGKSAKKIIRMAIDLWKNQEAADEQGDGMFYYNPTSVRGKELIADDKKKLENRFPDAIVISASSTVFGVAHMEGQVQQPLTEDQKKKYPTKLVKHPKGKEKTIIPLIFIPSKPSSKEWYGGKKEANYQSCNLYLEGTGFKLAEPEYVSLIAPLGKGGTSA